jgi:uncharacterized membrane protein SirB2
MSSSYTLLKALHVGAVVISGLGFVLRYALITPGAAQSALVRIGPHVVDTLLLVSAVALAWLLQANPLQAPWLAAKIVALPIYIAVGAIALRGPRRLRAPAFAAAIAVYCYIVGVAIAKHPLPWMPPS